MNYETIEFIVPDWSICALMYGDYSGLNTEDTRKVYQFTLNTTLKYGNAFFCNPESEGFKRTNEICSLGADCSKVEILANVEDIVT